MTKTKIQIGDRVSSPSTGTMLGAVLGFDEYGDVNVEWDGGFTTHGEPIECLTVYGKDDDYRLSVNNEEPVC